MRRHIAVAAVSSLFLGSLAGAPDRAWSACDLTPVAVLPPVGLVFVANSSSFKADYVDEMVASMALPYLWETNLDNDVAEASAGAWGNNSWASALADPGGGAHAAIYNRVCVRLKPGAVPKGPIHARLVFRLAVFTPNRGIRGSARVAIQVGESWDPLGGGKISIYKDQTTCQYRSYDSLAAITIFGPAAEIGLFSKWDERSPDEYLSFIFRDEKREAVKGPAYARRSWKYAADFDGCKVVRGTVSTDNGYAVLDPEYGLPPDRDDLELVMDAPPNPHPPGGLVTPEELAALVASGRETETEALLSLGMLGVIGACSNGVDDDGDGSTDAGSDPGCASADDYSERDSKLVCDDGFDDDGDLLSDYPDDPGCASGSDTTEQESTLVCDNGVDDDGDSHTDHPWDPGCTSANDASERESTLACDNGLDDDGDALADRPNDPGCTSPSDDSELESTLACDNGIDDDGDGFVDYPDDPACTNPSVETEASACENGLDDDGDGLSDYPDDPGCQGLSDASELSAVDCDDGEDDDGDGRVDFPDDPGCVNVDDQSEKEIGITCDDGVDNDGDARIDYSESFLANDDPGCTGPSDPSELEIGVVCDDGIDNDGDGAIDGADPGCADSHGTSEDESSCAGGVPIGRPGDPSCPAGCSDGMDNDGDGLTDYGLDGGCRSLADSSERDSALTCDDGIDQDADGLIDWPADPGCLFQLSPTEHADCEDAADNDGDGHIDYPADPECRAPGWGVERACGLGWEIVFLAPLVVRMQRLRNSQGVSAT